MVPVNSEGMELVSQFIGAQVKKSKQACRIVWQIVWLEKLISYMQPV
jgi:hypothetical protein